MSDLSSLIERLEAAEGPDRELDRAIALIVDGFVYEKRGKDAKPWFYHSTIRGRRQLISPYNSERLPAYTSSIDAAVSLAERVLPGWGWGVESKTHHIMACLNPEFGEPVGKHPHWAAVSNTSSRQFEDAATPALALVLATLRALQQKGGTE